MRRAWVFLIVLGVFSAVALAQEKTATKATEKTATKAEKAKPSAKKQAKGESPAPAATEELPKVDEIVPEKRWDGKTLAASEPGKSHVEVSAWPRERPMLLVHYPWKTHTSASVEVRTLADDESDTAEIRPLGFVARMLEGEVKMALFRCLDSGSEVPQTKRFDARQKGMDFEIVGLKNHLGRGAVQVIVPPKVAGGVIGHVAYYPLEPWSTDANKLRLELPTSDFLRKPGRLRVWFLREGRIVWWQTVAWPGMGQPPATVEKTEKTEKAKKTQ